MNKSEKLLAARKKLKEFQLHKSNHDQEVTSNSPNHHHHRENIDGLQRETNLLYVIKNNDENSTTNMNCEQLQTHIDSPHSNNFNNTEMLSLTFTQSDEKETKIENKRNDKDRDAIDNFDTNEEKTSLELSYIAMESLPVEIESKILDTVQLPNFDIVSDNSKTLEIGKMDNGADFFNNVNIQNSTHLLPTDIIDNKNNEKPTITTHLEFELENKSLLLCLEREKTSTHQLQIELRQSYQRISELENLLMQKNTEYNDGLIEQVNPLKEQLEMHRQAAEILVAEKAELNATVLQYQTVAQHKSDEVKELYEKLNNTISRLTDVERDLIAVKSNAEDDKILNEKLTNDYAKLEQQHTELKTVAEEQQLEIAELYQDLNIKKTQLSHLQQKMEENKNSLSLAELKIQQLTSAPIELEEIEIQQDAQFSLKQQLSHLNENLKLITTEKEEMCKHYESYVKQLNKKYEEKARELELAQKKINELNDREESLIQRLSTMEQNYQREKQKVESLLPLQAHEEKIHHLTKSMDSFVLEQENLQRALHEKEVEVESMKEELQELRELRDQSVETSKLVTALESEQLGASRAVSQNQQLKLQLNEMHDAFVILSNSKLNLTEQLQDERAIGRKLNAEYSRIETERDILKEELNRKTAVIDDLERDKLHFAQIADQMQHYQVQSNQTRTLEQELQNALDKIETLKRENKLLLERINTPTEVINKINIENETIPPQHIINVNMSDNINFATPDVNEQDNTESHDSLNNSHNTLSDNQTKLELRFKETMERVAELTDEKQRLEHLVLQLQGETETIGEYITLYQKQRAILQAKAKEKERTFNQLIEERNRQQAQLHQLKVLVADLLKIEGHSSNISASEPNVVPENADQPNVVDEKVNKEKSEEPILMDVKNETTSKILNLLTEIKDCKDACSTESNVHHCLWCSGKLITI